MENKKWFIPGSVPSSKNGRRWTGKQTVQDDMVKGGWIEDDNAEFILPVFIQYTYDKKNPGVYIEILPDEADNS